MLSKLVVIVILVKLLSSQALVSSANPACPRWVKLNKNPVCFGANGDQFGSFTYDRNIFVSSFMLVHLSKVTCHTGDPKIYSYWGCHPNSTDLGVILTDQNNEILAPEASAVRKEGWYTLSGYNSSSSILVFCAPKKPHCVLAGAELRLWCGEDLRGHTESNNGGKTCAVVFAILA